MLRRSSVLLSLRSLFDGIFLINLDRRPDRWSLFQEQFRASAGEEALSMVERVSAVDGTTLDMDALAQRGILSKLGRRRLQEPTERRIWGMDLTPGAVGCALSHMKLWARIAAAGAGTTTNRISGSAAQAWYLILEDDCVFPLPSTQSSTGEGSKEETSVFERLLRGRLLRVPEEDWGLLYLSGLDTAQQCQYLRVADGVARVPQFHRTTNAYIVTPRGAAALLATCVPLTYQIDTMMTMQVGPPPSSPQGGAGQVAGRSQMPCVLTPPCYTLMPPLITQSALVLGDIQDGEREKSMSEREAEEARRRQEARGGAVDFDFFGLKR